MTGARPARTLLMAAVFAAGAGAAGLPPAAGPDGDHHIRFVDVTARAGIDFVHASGASDEKYMFETFGSGVAWIDFDNDGFPDLYFVNGAPGSSNRAVPQQRRRHVHRRDRTRAGVAADGTPPTRPAWPSAISTTTDISTST
jgi:hypothetical protein